MIHESRARVRILQWLDGWFYVSVKQVGNVWARLYILWLLIVLFVNLSSAPPLHWSALHSPILVTFITTTSLCSSSWRARFVLSLWLCAAGSCPLRVLAHPSAGKWWVCVAKFLFLAQSPWHHGSLRVRITKMMVVDWLKWPRWP